MSKEIIGQNVVAKVEAIAEFGLYLNFEGQKILVLIPDAVVPPGTPLSTAFNLGDALIVKVIKYIPQYHAFKGTLDIRSNEHQ